MSTALRDAARDEFCHVLSEVPPESPTLCEGWDAFDLACHVWVLNHDPLAWLGMALPPLAGLTDRRLARVRRRFTYPELVEELRTGPASLRSVISDERNGSRHSLGEYFIHTEDVRRPNGLPDAHISPDLAEALWQRLHVAAAQLHPLSSWEFRTPQGGRGRIGWRTPSKRITGEPGELMLWAYGRRAAARVTVDSL
ncbi:MAG: maleylpyruvate isomerase family mycothiol-dependent enzyme [Propionibacteriaceae bacterium]|nr:maleylpyruvate isomerase family mycothiol-dependent enzyme [Propionibacteriaceae bacterium]